MVADVVANNHLDGDDAATEATVATGVICMMLQSLGLAPTLVDMAYNSAARPLADDASVAGTPAMV